MTRIKIGLIVLVTVIAAAQAFRIDKSNPPAQGALAATPEVQRLFQRACYDCHSNETVLALVQRCRSDVVAAGARCERRPRRAEFLAMERVRQREEGQET